MTGFHLSIQITPGAILNEGIDQALDFLLAHGLDALHLNSHTYYGANSNADRRHWAPDHLPDSLYEGMTERAWVLHDPAKFTDVGLFHRYPEDGVYGPDHFGDILAAARERNMKVHIRYLDGWEPFRHEIPGWRDILCRTLDGKQLQVPCFSHERVREWWRITAEDMLERYEVDGLFYGIERGSPLSDLLFWGQSPYCFCQACRAQAAAEAIDVERAAEGFRALHDLARKAAKGEPTDAPHLAMLMRLLIQYPEALAYDAMHERNKRSMEQIGARAVRNVRPEAAFSAILHQEADLFKRAYEDWAWHAGHSDAVVLRLYEHIGGPRLVDWANSRNASTILNAMSPAWRRELAWHLTTTNSTPCPTEEELRQGKPPAHAAGEVAHAVGLCGDRAEVHAAVGVDITHPFPERVQTPPEYIQKVVHGALAAGANAIVLCREYQEISGASMRAAAAAIEDGLRAKAGDGDP